MLGLLSHMSLKDNGHLRGKMGKKDDIHYLTQLLFDVEFHKNEFSFFYQVSIHFEFDEQKWERDVIMQKVKEWLNKMNIEFGEIIGKPIAIMCFHKSTTWSGTIKLHLKNPLPNSKSLL